MHLHNYHIAYCLWVNTITLTWSWPSIPQHHWRRIDGTEWTVGELQREVLRQEVRVTMMLHGHFSHPMCSLLNIIGRWSFIQLHN
jgi:hypothetical protein